MGSARISPALAVSGLMMTAVLFFGVFPRLGPQRPRGASGGQDDPGRAGSGFGTGRDAQTTGHVLPVLGQHGRPL